MQRIIDAIQAGQDGDATIEDFEALTLPESYKAAWVDHEDVSMFDDMATKDKDPRKSLHVDQVPLPELGPGEAFVAVMASAIDCNTVWTSIFEPLSTFGLLKRYGRGSELAKRHDLPYHIVGSDLSGVVVKVGAGVTKWKPGDRVVAHCLSVELESPDGHNDTMLDSSQRIWGYETNFGGLAEVAMVKANQLMPEPEHLTWEEAASPGVVNCTAYRRFGAKIRELTGGEDIDIVFEHPSRETFGASVYVTRKGGTITTCASTSDYMHEYDNRHLWMNLKRIISRHLANYRESWEANRLIAQGKVGVLCVAPAEGLGVRDHEFRELHLSAINRSRGI